MTKSNPNISEKIRLWAGELGFSHVGIAKAEFLEDEAVKLDEWLKRGYQGEMHYMENNLDMRLDPRKLVPGAKSVISLTYNYFTTKQKELQPPPYQVGSRGMQLPETTLKISKYAYGEDYHFVVKEKLKILMERWKEEFGEIHGRVFVDSAPVLERAWAARSGIGWIGKHSLLINKNQGSFFFLAEIILDLELDYDSPVKTDHCGTCTACIDACPTDAIVENKVVDGSKCISYFTIELKDQIPADYKNKFDDWMFGCDICQDICPWNRFSKQHNEPKFEPNEKLLSMSRKEWKEITEEIFNDLFKRSPVQRTKFEGLKRNILFLEK
ncbi:MAG: tRNA epoxyqueuosine(34) reductase QueG [Bacteroidota bacterium]|nr:tRNA epoxyqueuosine(34) reductase QueG [Bacteroidota bacterium]